MKKTIGFLVLILTLVAANVYARGGGGFSSGRSSFSSGRSSYSSGSFSSGRSSFSSPSKSTPSTSSSSSSFGTSSKGSFGRGSSTSRGSVFSTSSKGSYGRTTGAGDYKSAQYSIPRTNREVLSTSTAIVRTPYNSVPVYYYYYPTPWYGSGYSFYQYYYWSHFWGYHDHCYHNGGGQAAPRSCTIAKTTPTAKPSPGPSPSPLPATAPLATGCSEGETCDVNTLRCKLKQ